MNKNENLNEIVEKEETAEETVEKQAETAEETADENKELSELNTKYNELYDKYLRTLAEYDNFKKRTQKEKDELFGFAVSDTIGKILPIIDNLERALAQGDKNDPFVEGVDKVYQQCFEIFEKMGVEKIKAVGEAFDPNFHNAVMHTDDDTLGENVVAEELMAGYKYKDKVVRYSMVKVAN